MKDYKFPETDWSLCNHMDRRRMVGRLCLYHGLMAAWGKCMAHGVRSNAICPPTKKYIKDLKKIKMEKEND